MSLTSYRAAPPRVKGCLCSRLRRRRGHDRQTRRLKRRSAALMPVSVLIVKRRMSVLGRSGDDLLSRVLRHSTIGAEAFNGRVRDGIGFLAPRSDHRTGEGQQQGRRARRHPRRPFRTRSGPRTRSSGLCLHPHPITDMDHESNQANRAISTSQLNALPRLHIWPINVVVFHGSQGSTRFEVGFPLRCLQRLSRPYIATLHCGWRHNSSTRGTSIPVLSY